MPMKNPAVLAGFFSRACADLQNLVHEMGGVPPSLRKTGYTCSMNKKVLYALLLLPGMAQAVICKSVDAEGVVNYTDMPASECQKPVKLPPNSTYEPRQLPASVAGDDNATKEVEKPFEHYDSIQIIQPEADGTVRSNEGTVPVAIALRPTLQQGHHVLLHVDGKTVPGNFDGLSIELSGVERGTHSIHATITDAKGKTLIESSAVSFTLRQTGLYDGNANPPGPPPAGPVPRPRPGGG